MSRRSYKRMIDRGRKAGLNARELYQALSAKQPEIGDAPVGKADSNGYVAQVQANGQRSYEQPPDK